MNVLMLRPLVLIIALLLHVAVAATTEPFTPPCPANYSTKQYAIVHLPSVAYDEAAQIPSFLDVLYVSADVVMPLWPIGLRLASETAPILWLSTAFNLSLTFKAGSITSLQGPTGFNAGAKALMAMKFAIPSDEVYSLIAASLFFDPIGNVSSASVDVTGFPRIRVVQTLVNVPSYLVCTRFGSDGILGYSTPPVFVSVGMALAPIRISCKTTRHTQYSLSNVTLVVTYSLAGTTVEVANIISTFQDGDVVISNIRFTGSMSNVLVSVDLPDRLKTFPIRTFQFRVTVQVRSVAISTLTFVDATDTSIRPQAPTPLPVAEGGKLPTIVVLATLASGGLPRFQPTAGLCFEDTSSALSYGSCHYAPVIDGVATFDRIRLRAGQAAHNLVGRINVSGATVYTNRIRYLGTSALSFPSRLSWSHTNDQFYANGIPMVATHATIMPEILLYVLGSDGLVMDSTLTGTATASCAYDGGAQAASSADVSLGEGTLLVRGLQFGVSSRLACKLRIVYTPPSSAPLTIESSVGYIYPFRTLTVALAYARHHSLSYMDHRALPQYVTAGVPMPQITFLIRNSDWSIDRTNSVLMVNATTMACGAAALAVASGGEVHFPSLTTSCVGSTRIHFTADTSTSSVAQLLISGPITSVNNSATADVIFSLRLKLTGLGGLSLSSGSVLPALVGERLTFEVTTLGSDNTPISSMTSIAVRFIHIASAGMATLPSTSIQCMASPTCNVSWTIGPEYAGMLINVSACGTAVCARAVVAVRQQQLRPLGIVEVIGPTEAVASSSPLQLSLNVPGMDPNSGLTASFFTPVTSIETGISGVDYMSLPATASGLVDFPSVRVTSPRTVMLDTSFSPEIRWLSDPLSRGQGYHPHPFYLTAPVPVAADTVSVYISAKYRSFNTGQWVWALAEYLQIEASRIYISRVTDCYLTGQGLSGTVVELALLDPTTASPVKKSSAVARGELLSYKHTCTVAEKLRIFHVKVQTEMPPFCDAVALQELVEGARYCENAEGRNQRCACFGKLTPLIPVPCRDAVLIQAVCVHLASCLDIGDMCDAVRPNIAVQVVQVVFATAAIILVAMLAINYSLILDNLRNVKHSLSKRSKIVGPSQHHDDVFITS